jgi:predicted dithiol-disulfide oxidoreductase (DUF899 family)
MPEPTQSFLDVLSGYGPISQYEPGPRRPIDRELRQLLHRHPGVALEDGIVYHTHSTYVDGLWGMYQWLDRAPKGRNETGVWWRRHDEYDKR